MAMVLILATALSAPPDGCAKLAYCLAEARQAYCAAWPDGPPAMLTEEERPVHAIANAMEAKGCALPQDRLACPAEAPAQTAPPADCDGVR